MLRALCRFFSGHRYRAWQDFREPPFEDGRTFEIRRCRWCREGELRAKPYDVLEWSGPPCSMASTRRSCADA